MRSVWTRGNSSGATRGERENVSIASRRHRRHSATVESGRLIIFESARTAWALSLLLTLSLTAQFALFLQLSALDGDPLEDVQVGNSLATDEVNSAYGYSEGASAASVSIPAVGKSHWLNRYSN